MRSLRSRLLVAVLRGTGRKKPYLDPSLLRERISVERRTVHAEPPAWMARLSRIERSVVAGMTVYTIAPRGPAQRDVLFLHGGCYVFEISPSHYRFCCSLARLGCKVTIPIYPLAPENGAAEIQAKLLDVIDALGPMDAWIGDSAGGGLALALAQQATAKHLVLLSPWLDIALDDPAIAAIDERDPWLSRAGLREAGRLYARDLPNSDPRVSPLYGSLDKIDRISMWIGTRDVLLPDARRLRDRAPAKVTLVEYEDMVHDFMLVHLLPEARRAFDQIAEALGLDSVSAGRHRRGSSGTG